MMQRRWGCPRVRHFPPWESNREHTNATIGALAPNESVGASIGRATKVSSQATLEKPSNSLPRPSVRREQRVPVAAGSRSRFLTVETDGIVSVLVSGYGDAHWLRDATPQEVTGRDTNLIISRWDSTHERSVLHERQVEGTPRGRCEDQLPGGIHFRGHTALARIDYYGFLTDYNRDFPSYC
jgi:hypothetical protein